MSNRKRRGHNEGSLYQRDSDGRWVGSIVTGYDPATGHPRRKVVYGATKKEAQDKLADLQQKARAGVEDVPDMTVKSCLDFWLDMIIKPRVDPSTYKLHRQRVDDHLIPHVGHIELRRLTPFMVSQLYADLERSGCTPDLRNKVGQLLRRCLKHAVGFGLIRDNVAAKLPLPRVNAEEMHPLDEAQAKRFLAAATHYRLYPLFLMALDTGMRQGELMALEWSDIDFTAGIVSITKSLRTGDKGGARVKEVKTRSSRRRIRLTRCTLDALAAWKPKTPGKLVFPSRGLGPRRGRDTYLHKSCLLRTFLRVLHRAELPAIRFHDLRHTNATLALLKTKNVKAVSSRLGHKDIRVTLNRYAHYLPVMEEELVAAMEEVLAPAPAPVAEAVEPLPVAAAG